MSLHRLVRRLVGIVPDRLVVNLRACRRVGRNAGAPPNQFLIRAVAHFFGDQIDIDDGVVIHLRGKEREPHNDFVAIGALLNANRLFDAFDQAGLFALIFKVNVDVFGALKRFIVIVESRGDAGIVTSGTIGRVTEIFGALFQILKALGIKKPRARFADGASA